MTQYYRVGLSYHQIKHPGCPQPFIVTAPSGVISDGIFDIVFECCGLRSIAIDDYLVELTNHEVIEFLQKKKDQ